MEQPRLGEKYILPDFNELFEHFGTTNLKFIPLHHLLQSDLSRHNILFILKLSDQGGFIGLDVIPVKQLDVSYFVDFGRKLDVSLHMVYPQIVLFIFQLLIIFLSHFMPFLPPKLFIFCKPFVRRQAYDLLNATFRGILHLLLFYLVILFCVLRLIFSFGFCLSLLHRFVQR